MDRLGGSSRKGVLGSSREAKSPSVASEPMAFGAEGGWSHRDAGEIVPLWSVASAAAGPVPIKVQELAKGSASGQWARTSVCDEGERLGIRRKEGRS